jgi:hypothetical protein
MCTSDQVERKLRGRKERQNLAYACSATTTTKKQTLKPEDGAA